MDSKTNYSNKSREYVEKDVVNNEIDSRRYYRSKLRESKYGKNWEKNKVNINEVVEEFVPNCTNIYTKSGVKLYYENDKFRVIADKASGYLRIYNKQLKKFVKLDGTVGTNDETHFKIKRREEM